jgi:hypothetical protein
LVVGWLLDRFAGARVGGFTFFVPLIAVALVLLGAKGSAMPYIVAFVFGFSLGAR